VGHHADRSAFHGWFVVGLEEPASRWTDGIRDFDALDRLPGKPVRKSNEPSAGDATITKMSEEPVPDTKLAPHTTHFVFRTVPRAKGQAAAHAKQILHVYVVPDGSRTWLALGENDAQVVAKAKEVLAATPATGLAGRTDLGALHVPSTLAGFMTAGLLDALRSPDDGTAPTKTHTFFERLSAPPAIEGSPVMFLVPGSAGAADGVELRALAPKEVTRALLSRLH
jgi:hypothetical protein